MSGITYAGAGILPGMFVPCHRMVRNAQEPSDGKFGFKATYTEGEAFDAMLRKDSSPTMQVAERQGPKAHYTVVVGPGVTLRHGDVFRRDSDQMAFMVNGNTIDGEAPAASTIQIAKTTAEEWVIP